MHTTYKHMPTHVVGQYVRPVFSRMNCTHQISQTVHVCTRGYDVRRSNASAFTHVGFDVFLALPCEQTTCKQSQAPDDPGNLAQLELIHTNRTSTSQTAVLAITRNHGINAAKAAVSTTGSTSTRLTRPHRVATTTARSDALAQL